MLRNSQCAELNMASVWMLLLFNSLFISGLSMDIQLIKAYPKQAVFGVFEASLGKKYAFNASSARDVCEHLGATIASKAQVVKAHKHGLETCRFGWTDEQIAVVPRVQVKPNCGNGKVGVVVWRADVSIEFDVFCFNSTDFEIARLSQIAMTTETTTQKPKTTTPSSPRSSSSISPAISHLSSFNNIKEDTEKHLAISGTPVKTGVVPVALLITVTLAVLLAVFLALYHFKRNRRTVPDAERQQEDIETDVWENCSKKDLQKPQEENVLEKEEENNNNSSSSSSSSSSDRE